MTVMRNNSPNDDNTDTIASGITWFYFNGAQVTNLYVSGNSWIGFGASLEQLKVNRRDCKVYYEYIETGTIGTNRFCKLRWMGTSAYSSSYQTTDSYQQYFDVFLFDNGQIFLSFYKAPTSSFDGTNALVCGSATVSFSPAAGTAGEWTFTPSDAAAGTGWTVAVGRPQLVVNHKTSGSAVCTLSGITGTVEVSTLRWTQEVPDGTSLSVSVSRDGAAWTPIANGGPPFAAGETLSGATLHVKIEMATTDATKTPSLSGMILSLQTAEDIYAIILEMQPLQRFESAAGDITVAYDGTGSLAGTGGAVAAFSRSFAPTGLVSKPDQNDPEHLSIAGVTVAAVLTRIYYTSVQGAEHLSISGVSATAALTHINDI